MSRFCCCQDQKWCANFCCAGLNKQKKSQYAGVQFFTVPTHFSKEAEPSSSLNKEKVLSDCHAGDPSEALAKSYNFVQYESSVSLPPQISYPPEKLIVKQPQIKQPGAFMTRFRHVNVESSCHVSGPDQSLSVYREESANGTSDDAIVQFSLHYDVAQSKLRVNLQQAMNLPKTYDCNGYPVQCDPLVVLHLEPERGDTHQSQVMKCTYDPVFNKVFHFRGLSINYIRCQTLVFRIFNGALNNRSIGKASLPLADVDLFGIVVQMIVRTEEMEV